MGWKRLKYPFLIILIGLLIFLPQILMGKFFAGGDIINFASFSYEFQKQNFQEFCKIPLWNPWINSGTPFFANIIAAPNYIFNIFFIAADIPFQYWSMFSYMFHFLLAGLFTYFFARKIKLKKFPSFICAITFMFSHAFLTRFQGDSIAPIAYLPALFFFMEKFLSDKKPSSAILLSIFTALSFLSGHTQYFFYSAIIILFYFVYRIFSEKPYNKKTMKKTLSLSLLSLIIFLGLISIQFLPTLEYSKYSWRVGYTYDEAAKGSLPWIQLPTAIIPNLFGSRLFDTYWGSPSSELALYVGILPLIFALFAIFYSKNKSKNFFIFLAIFTLLFSLGKNFFLFFLFYKFFPGFSIFNSPSRMLIPHSFAIAILAGMGIENLFAKKEKSEKNKFNKKSLRIFSTILFLLSLFMLWNYTLTILFRNKILAFGSKMLESLYYGKYANTPRVMQTNISELLPLVQKVFNEISYGILIAGILILLTSFVFYLTHKKKDKKIINLIIILVLLIDISFLSMPYLSSDNIIHRSFPDRTYENIFSANEEILFLQNLNDSDFYRIYDRAGVAPQYLSLPNAIYKTTGYDTISLKKYNNYSNSINLTNEDSSEKLGLLNVKYVFSREKIDNPEFSLIKTFNDSYLYENFKFQKRFFIENSNEGVKVLDYSPDKIELFVNSSGKLVFSDVFYPGWHAFANGEEIPIYEYKNLTKYIELDTEDNNLIFEFKPKTYSYGEFITLAACLFLVLFFLLKIRRRSHI